MSEASINIDADADKQALEIKTQVDRKIVAKLTDLKLKDISEADARADLRRDSLKTGYVDKSKEDDDDLKKLLLEQHINASKVLSIPGEHICDSPVETRFIRNNKGDVIAKEFYVKEFYLKDCLSMSQTIVEAHHCFKIKYSLNITGTLVDKDTSVVIEIWNWKLFHNKMVDLFLGILLLASVIAIYALESKFGYIGIIGVFVGFVDAASGYYFKYTGLEEKLNKAAGGVLKRWVDSLKQFGEIQITGFSRSEKCVAFIEVVERVMTSPSSRETDLIKSGFGKTYYGIKVFDNHINFKQQITNFDLVRPVILVICQIITLAGSYSFLQQQQQQV